VKRPLATTVKENTKPVRNKVIVGVDYGTTYSGISFVMSVNSDARDVQVVTDWTGGVRKNEQLEKVPSKYAYAVENEGLTEDKWGYEVESWMISYSWTKLLLDENASETEFDNPHLQAQVGNGLMKLPAHKTAQEVASDFMRCLYKHIMAKLEKTMTKSMLKETPVHFWFTAPATWEDAANDATREAARTAGFESRALDELYMITEPEAAAMAILSNSIEKHKGLYKVSSSTTWLNLRSLNLADPAYRRPAPTF
jgi:molecular chaperone DnaK (HSP70)